MADHFLETPEYEQFKYLGLVYLKVIKSIKDVNLKNKFCRSVDPTTFTPPNKNFWICPTSYWMNMKKRKFTIVPNSEHQKRTSYRQPSEKLDSIHISGASLMIITAFREF